MFPSKYVIGALALLALLSGSFSAGWKIHAWRTDSANLKAVEQAREEERSAARKQAEAAQAMLERLQASQKNRRAIVKEIRKVEYIDRPCFDERIIGLLDRAAAGLPPDSSDKVP